MLTRLFEPLGMSHTAIQDGDALVPGGEAQTRLTVEGRVMLSEVATDATTIAALISPPGTPDVGRVEETYRHNSGLFSVISPPIRCRRGREPHPATVTPHLPTLRFTLGPGPELLGHLGQQTGNL